ncbi:hypothetical protein Ddye_032800 [Dipteronia dyeriana]|uniref:Uncharacterized protein n=1 Tax=Dipteronia dyeriana TaxID=168575 RepID=A0AAD9TCW4_9ROSI|nr:hypothetical protein Ddye_032800 [Dipteronia dyeriana]
MAEAVVSTILGQLASVLHQHVEEEVRLVVGVDEEVKNLTSNFQAIESVLEDAECKQVKEKAVGDWLEKLKDVSYDIEDVLDEWNTAIQKLRINTATENASNASKLVTKVCSLMSCFRFCSRRVVIRHDLAKKIKELNKTLDAIALERNRFQLTSIKGTGEVERHATTSIVDITKIHGRDHYTKEITNYLLSESSDGPISLPIISIVGMGGIGKTTLARLVFNDDEVKAYFDKKIWVCVSEPFDEIRIAKAILESLTNNTIGVNEYETVLTNIKESIKEKKFLLVLDDVWTGESNKWEQLIDSLNHGSSKSRILVTTRNKKVAISMGSAPIIPLEILSDRGSWSLFSQVAFSRKTNEECQKFEEVGRRIVKKCKGLPLAVKTLGSLLCFKNTIEEWQRVLDSEMWELEQAENGIFPPLLLSYFDLPSELKRCFLYCAIFPKDYGISKDQLIKLWMAQDYLKPKQNKDMELVGEECFEKLAMRSFFQDFDIDDDDGSIIRCKMHDMVHDMAQYLTKNECFSVEVDNTEGFQLHRNVHHSMIMLKRGSSFPISIFNENKLRSLVFDCNYSGERMYIDTSKLFDHMSCLRTLIFCNESIKDVPIGVNKLIHLRYLNISQNSYIKKLPKEVCELYNLQTLNVDGCINLKKLPEKIGKLINLRHLINDYTSLEYMPKGIERLSCLRTLDKVVMSGDKKACKFECLRNLNHLGGSLNMICSGGVDVGEINKAEFKDKTKLLALCIELWGVSDTNEEALEDFQPPLNLEELDEELDLVGYRGASRLSSEENVSNTNEEALEDFQPPPNLKTLGLAGYRGASRLSLNWMMSLTKLSYLGLYSWSGFERLSIGKLPFLESLEIGVMHSVKSVGNEFVGMESDNIPSVSSSSSLVVAFPKLQSLEFDQMDEWEEWDCGDYGRGEEQIKIMPCLRSLKISWCPKLKTLPDYLLQSTTLEHVNIFLCTILERRYRVEEAENWVKGSGIPKIRIYENPMKSDDLESSSPSVVSFHDDVEDELPETQTETAHISAIHSIGDDLESSSSSSLVADN